MIEVKAHTYKGNFTPAELDHNLEFSRTRLIERLRTKPAGIGSLIVTYLNASSLAHHFNRIDDAREMLNVACDCAGAMFAAISAPPDSQVTFNFRGSELQAPSGEPSNGSSPGSWISALLVAIAARREDTVDILRDVPHARFKDFPGEQDPCFLHWAAALRLFLEGGDFEPELAMADELARPENLHVATPTIVNRFGAIGPVLRAIANKDQSAFDQAMKACLEAHKKLFGRGKEANGPASLIDRHAAGLLVLGLQHDLKVGVRSEYIPDWLVFMEPPA
jgi:hypothetical protein